MQKSSGEHPSRGTFIVSAAAAAAGAYAVVGERPAPASAAPGYYPPFNWDRVPVAADIGKVTSNFSQSEVNFLANNFAYLSIEKSQATGLQPKGSERTEVGFLVAKNALKAANPNCKVLFYWSSGALHENYASAKSFNMAWGKQHAGSSIVAFDITQPAFRQWWIQSAATQVDLQGCDGVFIDGFNNFRADPNKEAMLRGLRDHVQGQGKDPIIIFNGYPLAPSDPASFLDVADGVFLEHFDSYENTSPDAVRAQLLKLQAVGKGGKIVHMKGWPGFTLSDPIVRTAAYGDLVAMSRKNITFPLACFLAIANPNSYFQYSWGYSNLGGTYILQDDKETVDPAWYPELHKPLGAPKGDAVIDGYTFTREFAHAKVHVDVSAHTASINWG